MEIITSKADKLKLDSLASKFAPAIYRTMHQDEETGRRFLEEWKEKYAGQNLTVSDCIARDAYKLARALMKESRNHKIPS